MNELEYTPDLMHDYIIKNRKPLLSYDPEADYDIWKEQIRSKLDELLGDHPIKAKNHDFVLEWEKEHETFIERRFTFYSEEFTRVPCHLWIPKSGKAPYPVVICLQGHSTGMHISMGRAKYEGDEDLISGGDRDFAVQIVKEGYAALVVEQRGFGERITPRHIGKSMTTCANPAITAILLGRTILRERAFDISVAIDMLDNFSDIDKDKIALMGNSGGGTATYYTACFEPRIKVVMPSCAVCSFEYSIGTLRHCICNHVPGIAKYMDMGEMACLIAPRPLIVVAGEKDHGFLYPGVQKVYKVIEQIYAKEGAPDNCKLITGPEGHRFYADISWPTFRKYFIGE